jgi:hypothetical protein
MKIDSIVVAPGEESLAMLLNFDDPSGESPYQVLEIEGLDAGELLKSYSARGTTSGKRFFNFTLPKREPVIKVGLNPRFHLGETVSSLRDDIYRSISITRDGTIEIQFWNGAEEVAVLSGTISGVEPAIFEKRPTVEIRLECDDPILRARDIVDLVLPTTAINEVAFDDEMSTAPHGLIFVAQFVQYAKDFKISDDSNDWSFTVTPRSGFDPGDQLIFIGDPSERAIYRERDEEWTPLADVVARNSQWPVVFPLANQFNFNRSVIFSSVGHKPAYWGL